MVTALTSHDAGKCQLSMFLVSQEDWSKEEEGPWSPFCTGDLLYIIQAQDVSVGSPEILDFKKRKKKKDKSVAQAVWEACQLVFVVLFVFFNKRFLC